jgi:hypothetical protein
MAICMKIRASRIIKRLLSVKGYIIKVSLFHEREGEKNTFARRSSSSLCRMALSSAGVNPLGGPLSG